MWLPGSRDADADDAFRRQNVGLARVGDVELPQLMSVGKLLRASDLCRIEVEYQELKRSNSGSLRSKIFISADSRTVVISARLGSTTFTGGHKPSTKDSFDRATRLAMDAIQHHSQPYPAQVFEPGTLDATTAPRSAGEAFERNAMGHRTDLLGAASARLLEPRHFLHHILAPVSKPTETTHVVFIDIHMGVDKGFDLYPPLENTDADNQKWAAFFIEVTYLFIKLSMSAWARTSSDLIRRAIVE
ncbi:hypothetical protein DFH09DRAFT_1095877 [Mycena vulgaris]|nr:hypothetical protein DFH09DRAFT_1095877 [Mycena vulgaris]